MAKKSTTSYFGLNYIISIILAIIPITNIIFGIYIRATHNNILGVILNIFLCPIFYIIDLVSIIMKNKIFILV